MNRKDAESDARDVCGLNGYNNLWGIAMDVAGATSLTKNTVEKRLQAAIVREVADIYEEFGEE